MNRAWGIQEIVHGENLGNIWDKLKEHEQMQIIGDLASLVARLHRVTMATDRSTELFRCNWYRGRIDGAVEWLVEQGKIAPEMRGEISRAAMPLVMQTPHRVPGCIHGDILFHNIFVKQVGARWEIEGLIDWETLHTSGCPSYDALLGAWWMADEDTDQRRPEIFAHFIKTYNQAVATAAIPTNPQDLDLLLKLVDMTWYLQVLPFTLAREPQRFKPRFEAVTRILDKIRDNEPHLPPDFRI